MSKRLGKGLDDLEGLAAIFGSDVNDVLDDIQKGHTKVEGVSDTTKLLVKEIKANPYQPRTNFDEQALQELKESIALHGVFTPILVKKAIKGYELIAGERRLRASKLAGLTEIPAMIVDFDDTQMMEIALLENIQRENLNAIEEAQALSNLLSKLSYTQEELAKRVGKSREYVANMLRLLKLPKIIQEYVVNKQLSMGHVRALLGLSGEETMILVAKKAIQEKMSVRAVEAYTKQLNEPVVKVVKAKDHTYDGVMNLMQNKLQTQVKIEKQKITISFSDTNDLNRILEIMDCLEEE